MRSIFLLFPWLFLLACNHSESSEDTGLVGFWEYHGKEFAKETALLQFTDTLAIYLVENKGLFAYRYSQRNDSILFLDPTSDNHLRVSSIDPDTMILYGSTVDTLLRLSRREGIERANHIKNSLQQIDLTPPTNQ